MWWGGDSITLAFPESGATFSVFLVLWPLSLFPQPVAYIFSPHLCFAVSITRTSLMPQVSSCISFIRLFANAFRTHPGSPR